MRTLRASTVIALALFAGALAPAAGRASVRAPDPASIDVVLAFDGTASMKTSIAQAKQDGERLLAGLAAVDPQLRAGVVVFRDYRNPAGEYQVLQSLTPDTAAVRPALERVRAVSNPDPANGVAESYSLLFRKSYTDPAIGWRLGARKILVVIGDAEPYGAGDAGLPGCRSKRSDPHGLDAADELARMRANRIVLLMVRQVSSETSATLGCYEALAQRADVGSAARDGGGRSDLVAPIVALLKQVFAPLRIDAGQRTIRRGSKVRYVLSLSNRSARTLSVAWVQAALPRSFRYVGASIAKPPRRRGTTNYSILVWYLNRTLAPGQTARITFIVRPTTSGKHRVRAQGQSKLATGLSIGSAARSAELTIRR